MARLTLRLPASLHAQPGQQAHAEGVSLNQYIVFSLTKTDTASQMAAQWAQFRRMASTLPESEAEQALTSLLNLRPAPSHGE